MVERCDNVQPFFMSCCVSQVYELCLDADREHEPAQCGESSKKGKMMFRLQATGGDGRKRAVACERNVQNSKNSVSLASESFKIGKTTFRSQAK